MSSADAVERAWARYLADLEETRQLFLAEPILEQVPALRANAHFILAQTQALAYNNVIAPRPDHPYFVRETYFDPLVYSGHQPCPDFLHRATFLNGRRRWRIHGRRNTAHWVDIQVQTGFWGEPEAHTLDNYDLDQFAIGADGRFELIASSEPEPGNWIRLDPAVRCNYILVRQAMLDWGGEEAVELHIEPADDRPPEAGVVHDEAEVIRRLDLAGRMMKFCVGIWTAPASRRVLKHAEKNSFVTRGGDGKRGANPLAHYGQCIYEIAPDEALIVECEVPRAPYWGISLGSWWFETIDYTFHQSSLNGRQAVIDADGRFRAVLSRQDPGVPNWLDPIVWNTGLILLRWYRPDRVPVPVTRRVPLAEVRRHLPAETPLVTPQQRRAQLEQRRRDSLARYRL